MTNSRLWISIVFICLIFVENHCPCLSWFYSQLYHCFFSLLSNSLDELADIFLSIGWVYWYESYNFKPLFIMCFPSIPVNICCISSKQLDHNSIPIDLTKSIFMIFWTSVLIFVFCEIGHLVTQQFEKFNAELNQCNWYLYSLEMQRILAIFMSNAHQSTYIRGIGNILCSRRKIKEVRKFGFLLKLKLHSVLITFRITF